MTDVLIDTRTFTDRAVSATAGRALHAAVTKGRPHRDDADLVVAYQGERGIFINPAVVLVPSPDWDDVLRRIDEVIPPGVPATLFSAFAVPDLSGSGWMLLGHPPFMVRPASGAAPAPPAELTVIEVDDRAALETFEHTIVDAYPVADLQPYRWG
jgi:hypothetical protein